MQLAPLVALQGLDARLHALRRRREDVPRSLAAAVDRVDRAQAALDEYRKRQKTSKVEVDRRELDLKTLESRIEKLEGQLNQCKTNKEYALLKKEIDGFKADKGVLDDEILRLMMAVEEKDQESLALAGEVQAAAEALAAERTRADAAIAEIDREIDALQQERGAAADRVEGELLRKYERILNGKPDRVAIVSVVDGVCQGCYMDITSQEINLLLIGRDVYYCKNCSRILYIVKEPAAAEGKS